MKKIDFDKGIIGVDGKKRSRKEIEDDFRAFVENEIKEKLKDLKNSLGGWPKVYIDKTDEIIHEIEEGLLIMLPKILEKKTEQWDKFVIERDEAEKDKTKNKSERKKLKIYENYRNKLVDAFGYKNFRSNGELNQLALRMNVKTCVYCNQNYTIAIGEIVDPHKMDYHKKMDKLKNTTAFLQFDHFYNKSTYPHLSMCLYNLVPSCGICNNFKSTRSLNLDLHPYHSDISSLFRFEIKDKNAFTSLYKDKTDNLEIILVPNKTADSKLMDFFEDIKLKKRYSRYKDEVLELETAIYMNPCYKNMKENLIKDLTKNMSDKEMREKAVERFLTGYYPDRNDINKRPLTKFMQDITEQLKPLL